MLDEIKKAALELLAEKNTLTLEDLAQKLNMSLEELQKNIPNKEELFAALVSDGFGNLKATLMKAIHKDRPLQTLEHMSDAYIDFAHSNPHVFRLMLGSFLGDREKHQDLLLLGQSCFMIAFQEVDGFIKKHSKKQVNPLEFASRVWSALHGVTLLSIDGRIDVGSRMELDDDKVISIQDYTKHLAQKNLDCFLKELT